MKIFVNPVELRVKQFGTGSGPYAGTMEVRVVHQETELVMKESTFNVPFSDAVTIDDAIIRGLESFRDFCNALHDIADKEVFFAVKALQPAAPDPAH